MWFSMPFDDILSWEGNYLLQGYWWIPGREEQELFGVLTLSDEGIILEVSEPFIDESGYGDLSQINVIYGLTSRGQNVTGAESKVVGKFVILQNCSQAGQNSPLGNTEVYRTNSRFYLYRPHSIRYTKYRVPTEHQFDLQRNKDWV